MIVTILSTTLRQFQERQALSFNFFIVGKAIFELERLRKAGGEFKDSHVRT